MSSRGVGGPRLDVPHRHRRLVRIVIEGEREPAVPRGGARRQKRLRTLDVGAIPKM